GRSPAVAPITVHIATRLAVLTDTDIQQLIAPLTIHGNREIKRTIGKSILHPPEKLRAVVTGNHPVVFVDFAVIVYIAILDVAYVLHAIMRMVIQFVLIAEHTFLFEKIVTTDGFP